MRAFRQGRVERAVRYVRDSFCPIPRCGPARRIKPSRAAGMSSGFRSRSSNPLCCWRPCGVSSSHPTHGSPTLPPIRSLAYLQPVVAELQLQPLSDGYLDYLRHKLQRAGATLPTRVQKTRFPEIGNTLAEILRIFPYDVSSRGATTSHTLAP